MHLLEALASIFFKTFGITQPSPRNQRRAAWFLLALLLLALTAIAGISAFAYHILH